MDKPISRLTPDEVAARVRLATANALADPELAQRLAAYAYPAEALDAATAEADALQAAIQRYTDLTGQARQAADAFNATTLTFRDATLTNDYADARRACRDQPALLTRLRITTTASKAFDAWTARAAHFYTLALADGTLGPLLATKALTPERLAANQAELQRLLTLRATRDDLKGQAQQARRDRDAAAKQLQTWLSRFKDDATGALADRPDWLERLGFRERS